MPNLFSNLLKTLSSIENVKIFPILTRDFWHIANNISNNFTSSFFPPLLQPDGYTAFSSFSKAELFAQTYVTNSTLDDTGHISLTPPPLTTSSLNLKFFIITFCMPSMALKSLLLFLKNCASELHVQTPSRFSISRLWILSGLRVLESGFGVVGVVFVAIKNLLSGAFCLITQAEK